MIDYDAVDTATPEVQIQQTTLTVVEEVAVRPVATKVFDGCHALKPMEEWGWEELRSYVVQAIEQRHGAFPRNFKTEGSIFKSFATRWGTQAGPIAVAAFEVFDGMWRGAPIGVNRFCRASDIYFAQVISDRL